MNKFMRIVSAITLLVFLRVNFGLAAEQVYFYYTDPAGTPLAMSDASGEVVWRAEYQPFGEGDTPSPLNNKTFVGKEIDNETGLHYFGARYMDTPAGRFVAPDPVGAVNAGTGKINEKVLSNPQRLNLYAYAGNNPYAIIDPDGLDWLYSQSSGRVVYRNNSTLKKTDHGIRGYAGAGPGLNNPERQNRRNEGPIVEGTYTIGPMETMRRGTPEALPNSMHLMPDADTAEKIANFGRTIDSFWWHGDYADRPYPTYEASTGCIISERSFRNLVASSEDKTLRVVPFLLEDFAWRPFQLR